MSKEAAILGAGIQGCCAALALAADGHRVTLIDGAEGPLQRASLRNTGKIHLGHVYAGDSSLQTSMTMLESSIKFAPLLEEWFGQPINWDSLRTPPYTYLLMKDSIVANDEILNHYRKLESIYSGCSADANYLGTSLRKLHWDCEIPDCVNRQLVESAIATPEVSLKVGAFCRLIKRAISEHPLITPLMRHRVCDINIDQQGFRISGKTQDGKPWEMHKPLVVNALWQGRLEIDSQLGIVPNRPWVHRLKYRVFARMPESLREMQSLSMALGPYGDIVPLGDEIYLQWYPAARKGWSTDIVPPESWENICQESSKAETLQVIGSAVREGLARIVPELSAAHLLRTDAGIIFAWGDTDIDELESEFHQRHETGIQTYRGDLAGYISIDTGKFTCAPMYADDLRRFVSGQPAKRVLAA